MTRHISMDAHLYVDSREAPLRMSREAPLRVTMHVDESSEVCTIQFGSSFTLGVIDPVELRLFAKDLLKFADRAHELHYGPDEEGAHRLMAAANEEDAFEAADVDDSDDFYAALLDTAMAKMSAAQVQKDVSQTPQTDPMNDPVNW